MQTILKFVVSLILVIGVALAHAENNLKEFEQEFSDSVITTKITAKFTKNRHLNPLKFMFLLKMVLSLYVGMLKIAKPLWMHYGWQK